MPDTASDADLAARPAKRSATVFGLVTSGQFDRAFAELYNIQRGIRKNADAVSGSDRHAYFAISYLLVGAPLPPGTRPRRSSRTCPARRVRVLS